VSIASRIYLKILWLKKAYPFNWAHKPLCTKYEEDLLKIKNMHICRSCFLAYSGMIINLLFLIISRDFFLEHSGVIVSGLLSVTLPLSQPIIYKKLPRKFRDLIRFLTGALIVQIVFALLAGQFILTLIAICLCYISWRIYFTQRAIRKIDLCHACPEYFEQTVCSGYKAQQSLIREYEEEATEYVLSTGYIPKILK